MPEYAHDFKNVTSVGIGAFAKAHFDGAVNLSKVQTLPNAADCPEKPEGADHDYGVFEGSNFSNGNFSNLTYIGSRSFYGCYINKANNSFPKVEEIGAEAFKSANIYRPSDPPYYTEVYDFSSVNKIGANSFEQTADDTNANRVVLLMPNVTEIGDYAFLGAKALPLSVINGQIWIDLPSCTKLGEGALSGKNNSAGNLGVHGILLKNIERLRYKSLRWTSAVEIHIGERCSVFEDGTIIGLTSNVDLYLYNRTPPTLNGTLDGGSSPHTCPNHIYVPDDCITVYRNSIWGTIKDTPDSSQPLYLNAITPMSQAPNPQDW